MTMLNEADIRKSSAVRSRFLRRGSRVNLGTTLLKRLKATVASRGLLCVRFSPESLRWTTIRNPKTSQLHDPCCQEMSRCAVVIY